MINSRDNELFSGLSHFVGFLLSIAGLVLLVVFSSIYGNAPQIVGFSIFGSALILLYFASALYHFISKVNPVKEIFRAIDYSMIYVLIAGTYTPIVLSLPERNWGWTIFGIVWGLACVGIILEIKRKNYAKWFAPALYLIMGWLSVFILPLLLKYLPQGGLFWLVLGGVLYTFGVFFFVLENKFPRKGWFGAHEMFHLFVMAGSFSHFWLMFKYVLYI